MDPEQIVSFHMHASGHKTRGDPLAIAYTRSSMLYCISRKLHEHKIAFYSISTRLSIKVQKKTDQHKYYVQTNSHNSKTTVYHPLQLLLMDTIDWKAEHTSHHMISPAHSTERNPSQ